jgi:hypothetical protein
VEGKREERKMKEGSFLTIIPLLFHYYSTFLTLQLLMYLDYNIN